MGKKPYVHPCIPNPATGRAVMSNTQLGRRLIRKAGFTAGMWLPSKQPGYNKPRGYRGPARVAGPKKKRTKAANLSGLRTLFKEPAAPKSKTGHKRRKAPRAPSKRARTASTVAVVYAPQPGKRAHGGVGGARGRNLKRFRSG